MNLERNSEHIEARVESQKLDNLFNSIKTFEIRDLVGDLETLMRQLKEHIESADYKTIIGDDASARIPTLVFDKLFRKVYKDKGLKSPETLFVAGSSWLDDSDRKAKTLKLNEYLSTKNIQPKVLIITDTISTGKGLMPLTEFLRGKDIPFDIATVGLLRDHDELEEKLGGRIFFGPPITPHIYAKPGISGVEKDPSDVVSKPIARGNFSDLQEKINVTRKDAGLAADYLYEVYKSKV